jgi:hypothetical protein
MSRLLTLHPRRLPVNDFILVEILEAKNNASGVEDGAGLGENVGVNVHHQIATCRVFHHETNVRLFSRR